MNSYIIDVSLICIYLDASNEVINANYFPIEAKMKVNWICLLL